MLIIGFGWLLELPVEIAILSAHAASGRIDSRRLPLGTKAGTRRLLRGGRRGERNQKGRTPKPCKAYSITHFQACKERERLYTVVLKDGDGKNFSLMVCFKHYAYYQTGKCQFDLGKWEIDPKGVCPHAATAGTSRCNKHLGVFPKNTNDQCKSLFYSPSAKKRLHRCNRKADVSTGFCTSYHKSLHERGQCTQKLTGDGKKWVNGVCPFPPLKDKGYCYWHNPSR